MWIVNVPLLIPIYYLIIYLFIRATTFYGLTGQEAVHCSPSTVFSTVILKECFFKLLSRESESGLISCCINGVRESLPFDINTFDLRGALQYGDMVRNEITPYQGVYQHCNIYISSQQSGQILKQVHASSSW